MHINISEYTIYTTEKGGKTIMDFKQIEEKWRKKWEDTKLYKFDINSKKPKFYELEMFSYPSGAKLHAGHWYNYGPADSYARFKMMQGYNVFHPMGFDAFGLPAENYAIKTGIHPQDSTRKNIETMEEQLKKIGATYDWDYEIKTCESDYYKWTQWMFVQLYKKGLAYRKEAPVNWCTSCNTVLANEQVQNGECERCHSIVEKRNLTQWFFKITDYAEELLKDLDALDWPEKTKAMQRYWIGKSEGAEVDFKIEKSDKKVTVFTTRADTLFGVTYVVLAPENPIVKEITTKEHQKEVDKYIKNTLRVSEIDRMSATREKTGVLTGGYVINPVNGDRVPILVADYVIGTYGTGAVMGVAAHDDRDFDFAKKLGLEIKRVIKNPKTNDDLPYCEDAGILCNSGKYDGLNTASARKSIVSDLEKQGNGRLKINYRLRDWLVSRQRYWGAPIPVIHCEHCGEVLVEESNLPVLLPYNVNFTPDGESPLQKCDEFMNIKCPKCGRDAKRDPDTLDTFVCSSWYYLRYTDSKNDKAPFDTKIVDQLLPVDKYVGGAEHACMHLLYARFFTKALRDMGYIHFSEPFKSLVHQGIILGPDGQKMSKSRGNVVSPDDAILKYGSDVFRLYLMFGFNYVEGGPWSESGLDGIAKFLERVERIVEKSKEYNYESVNLTKDEKQLNYTRNNTIKSVTNDMENFSFNTAVARIMELVNALYSYDSSVQKKHIIFKDSIKDLILLLAPFAPHRAEELWEMIGGKYSVFNQVFPITDEKALVKDEIEIVVQINAKIRGKLTVEPNMDRAKLEKQAIDLVKDKIVGDIKKVIVVPNKLVNIII